ncbi:uncharacterized protein TNCT_210321 [Trichonephila clavata]|uniref:Uncharacterized protein n=1 Tax=Trichonephila clavata TaxID=2740835 RepID=A0A8X6J6X3_TRICU|nr:uncharacterized protein TNCT_210321 [Trichonephila clavata]
MILKNKTWGLFLIAIQLCCVLTPSDAIFDMFGGGGGGGESDVAEILAAGLITTMLMEDFNSLGGGGGGGSQGRSVFPAIRQFIGGYSMRPPPVHHYQPMIAPRRPMLHPAASMVPPARPMVAPRRPMMHPYSLAMMHRHHQYMMHQALMQQARQQALATAWNNEYRTPYASETIIPTYVPLIPTFSEILGDEDTLSAATILLNSDLLDNEDEEEEEEEEREEVVREEVEPKEPEETPVSKEEYEVASSDHESRYILPRIVRHFVQRLMRRVEHH